MLPSSVDVASTLARGPKSVKPVSGVPTAATAATGTPSNTPNERNCVADAPFVIATVTEMPYQAVSTSAVVQPARGSGSAVVHTGASVAFMHTSVGAPPPGGGATTTKMSPRAAHDTTPDETAYGATATLIVSEAGSGPVVSPPHALPSYGVGSVGGGWGRRGGAAVTRRPCVRWCVEGEAG